MLITRRELFRNWKDNLIESLQDNLKLFLNKTPFVVGTIHESHLNELPLQEEKTWILLGNVSDFPPGSSTLVNNGKQVLISKSTGFYVLDLETYKIKEREPRRLIRFGKAGNIMMKAFELCPAGTVLSVMTEELVIEEEAL